MILNDRGLSLEKQAYGAFRDAVNQLSSDELYATKVYRDSEGAHVQHRHKGRHTFDDDEILLLSARISMCASRFGSYIADRRGIEQLCFGRFFAFCQFKLGFDFVPAEPISRFAAALRRPAEKVDLQRRRARRLRRSERLGVREVVAFETVCQSMEIRGLFLEMLGTWDDSDQVPSRIKQKIGSHVVEAANRAMDDLDKAAFGTVLPHWPSAFDQITAFWNRAGVAYLAARSVLAEYADCEVEDFFHGV